MGEEECTLNPTYMGVHCKESCGLCKDPCKDDIYQCGDYKKSGHCSEYSQFHDYMYQHCPVTCNMRPICQDARDYKDDCGYWALIGDCSENPEFMSEYCKQSCNLCSMHASEFNPYGGVMGIAGETSLLG